MRLHENDNLVSIAIIMLYGKAKRVQQSDIYAVACEHMVVCKQPDRELKVVWEVSLHCLAHLSTQTRQRHWAVCQQLIIANRVLENSLGNRINRNKVVVRYSLCLVCTHKITSTLWSVIVRGSWHTPLATCIVSLRPGSVNEGEQQMLFRHTTFPCNIQESNNLMGVNCRYWKGFIRAADLAIHFILLF